MYVCEHIFWHWLSDVIGDDDIAKSHAICVLTAKSKFFARNLLNTYKFTIDSAYFVDFNRQMLFSRQSEVQKWKFEQNLKISKSKMAADCDVIYLTIVAMETNWTPRGFA